MAEQIGTDTSPDAMRRAIEDNTIDYWRLMATSGEIWIEETDDLITVGAVEKPSAFRDSVFRTRFSEIDAEERIDTTLARTRLAGGGPDLVEAALVNAERHARALAAAGLPAEE